MRCSRCYSTLISGIKDNAEYPEHAITIAVPGYVTREVIRLARKVYHETNSNDDVPAKYVQAWPESQMDTAREIAGTLVAVYSREVAL